MLDNHDWKTFFNRGDLNWITVDAYIASSLQEWEGLDNIPKKGGALIIYYHGVSTGCSGISYEFKERVTERILSLKFLGCAG